MEPQTTTISVSPPPNFFFKEYNIYSYISNIYHILTSFHAEQQYHIPAPAAVYYQQQLKFDLLIPHCCLSNTSFFIFVEP